MKIEKGVPIPEKIDRTKIWEKMEVGDSVFSDKKNWQNAYLWARSENNGYKFAERPEGNGYRIWRVK